MNKSNQNIKFKGNKMNIRGQDIKEGQKLPNFQLIANDLSEVTNQNYAGKVLVISVIPSIDTPTCQLQTKRFNQEGSQLGSNLAILTVSRDLPFAQKRWCAAEGANSVVTLSDYKYRSFGETFGVEAVDMALLARAVFVVDKNSVVKHVEYVEDLSAEPDYQAVLEAATSAL